MNTKTQAVLDTLRPALPWTPQAVIFLWLYWTLLVEGYQRVPLVINVLVGLLVAVVFTAATALAQYGLMELFKAARNKYKVRVTELEKSKEK